MRNFTIKIIFAVCLICAVNVVFNLTADAASIYFDVDSKEVGTGSPFPVRIYLDSTKPINAVELTLDLPEGLKLENFSDGNSIINLWVEKPNQKGSRVTFAGLMPNGYQGEDAKLVELNFLAQRAGEITITIDSESLAHLNNASGTAEKISSPKLNLRAVAGIKNATTSPADTIPPEEFVPKLVNLGTTTAPMWAAAFATQDKGSGVAGYEIYESSKRLDAADPGKGEMEWQKAESPYVLNDQKRHSYIYIKAVDRQGNERIETISPQPAWSLKTIGYIIIIAIVLIGLHAIVLRKRKNSTL